MTQAALRSLGVAHAAAVVAAEAGALCAEAEVARARDAAGHMMTLADQIQGMFALCEVGAWGGGQRNVGAGCREWMGGASAARPVHAAVGAWQQFQLRTHAEPAVVACRAE